MYVGSNLFLERQRAARPGGGAMFINAWDYLSLTRRRLSFDAPQSDIYMRILNGSSAEIFHEFQPLQILE